MKIAFVNNQLQLGGAETVVRQLWAGVRDAGHETDLFVAHGKHHPRHVRPLYPRLLSRFSHSRLHSVVEYCFPRAAWTNRAVRALAEGPHDVVHIHSFHGDYATIPTLAQLARRKPVVWTFHRFWGITGGCDHPGACDRYLRHCGECPRVGEWPIGPVDTTREGLASKMQYLRDAPLHIVAPSRHLADRVSASRVGDRWGVTHIPNGVDASQFDPRRKHEAGQRHALGVAADAVTVLVVNRNFKDPLKGFPVVEQALHALPDVGIQVMLVGAAADWGAERLPAHHRPISFGYVDQPQRLRAMYETADVFLYASPGENFPCVVLEAMAAACCVVSTPTDGVLEQVTTGETGLIAADMRPAALASALTAVVHDGGWRRRLGMAARHRVETRFGEGGMVEAHLRLYESMLTARRPA